MSEELKIISHINISKNYADNLQAEVDSIIAEINTGKKPVFDSIDSMFATLEIEA